MDEIGKLKVQIKYLLDMINKVTNDKDLEIENLNDEIERMIADMKRLEDLLIYRKGTIQEKVNEIKILKEQLKAGHKNCALKDQIKKHNSRSANTNKPLR